MKKGFTLIELLIVVAIIAILAAIAIPNFLNAQVRAKVSRVKADMRSIATGLESYYVDNNAYPYIKDINGTPTPVADAEALSMLSTPVAYLTDPHITDPFGKDPSRGGSSRELHSYGYYCRKYEEEVNHWGYDPSPYSYWIDSDYDRYTAQDGDSNYGPFSLKWELNSDGPNAKWDSCVPYDPTNGTTSAGDICRFGP